MALQHANTTGRKLLASSLKSSISRSPIVSINLSILEDRLRKCRNSKNFFQIHAQMTVSDFINDAFAASRLLSFSTSFPFLDLNYSIHLLYHIENRNAFSWNTVMRAFVQKNLPHCCLALYRSMLKEECSAILDNYTHPIVLQACALRFCVLEGEQIHAQILKLGLIADVYVLNTLINMYSVCGRLEEARSVFEESPALDSVSWNSILAAYVQIGDVKEAIYIYDKMPEQNTIASNSMIVLLGRSGSVEDARKLFDEMINRDTVSWTAMIGSYEQNKMFREALNLFDLMRSSEARIDEIAMVSVLSACASLGAAMEGEVFHGLIIRSGIQTHGSLRNSLIHMYSSCRNTDAAELLFESGHPDQFSWNIMISGYLKSGLADKAKQMFNAIPQKDSVSWSTMISGYAQQGLFSDALGLFHEMQTLGIRPDETTLVSVLSSCTNMTALEQGKWVHTYIMKHGFQLNAFLGTTLIDMYMKCGNTEVAREIFGKMGKRTVSTWNAMILGLAVNGFFEEALEMFSNMERAGLPANESTFVGVLGACRHGGLVDEGRKHFESMKRIQGVEPNIKHYGCMVDLLGRAGLLDEAEMLVENMPIAPDVSTWGALLGACKKHGNAEMGERVGRKLIELDPRHDGCHVLLSNIYASRGKWKDLMEVRAAMKKRRIGKIPGCSVIEAGGAVHEFVSGDNDHPQMKEIEQMLMEMGRKLRAGGYRANTTEVAFDIEDEEKESSVNRHSERLAIAFGLISTIPPSPIRIMKNLRICNDCHAAAKILSDAFEREIVLRDRHRFHRFSKGACSCADYW